MKKYVCILSLIVLIFYSLSFTNLRIHHIPVKDSTATLSVQFTHCINDTPALFHKTVYTNRAGNKYILKELQYFISEIALQKNDGSLVKLIPEKNIHYVDVDIAKTLLWTIPVQKDTGIYIGMQFRFGINQQKNKDFLFRNPPENLMDWPDWLGGGYHYMKLNLKYTDKDGKLSNFNCHPGPGKANETDTATVLDNSFMVLLIPSEPIVIQGNKTTSIQIQMNINKWFDGQFIMDMNQYEDGIMNNQKAIQQFCINGSKAFTLKAGH